MKRIIFSFIFALLFKTVLPSECYNYHTSTKTELLAKDNAIYFQFTERDPNGFSYVVQYKRPLRNIDVASFKLLGEDDERYAFSDKNGVYNLQKSDQRDEGPAKFTKILNLQEATRNIDGKFFLIGNKWTYITAWSNKITKLEIPELPINLSGIKTWSGALIAKDAQKVYALNIDLIDLKLKYTLKIFPNLAPGKTVYYACNPGLNEDYLADNDHFFSIRNDGTFEDHTPQLLALGMRGGFDKMQLIDRNIPVWQYGKLIFKKKYGTSGSGINPQTGEDIDVYYTYSAARYLSAANIMEGYLVFRNRIYPIWDDVFSSPYQVNSSAENLSLVGNKMFKGQDNYYMESDNLKIISTGVPASAQFFDEVYSYNNYLYKALVTDDFIYFFGDRYEKKNEIKKALTSKIVKQLGMFYLFNNALFDGEKSYPVEADEETLTYLGSFVEVINSCGGDMPNTPQVEVAYHHFLKDKNAVYYFDNKLKKLIPVQTADVAESKVNDYDYMQSLYKVKDVKGTVKKKSQNKSSKVIIFSLVGIGLLAGLILLVSYQKKKA